MIHNHICHCPRTPHFLFSFAFIYSLCFHYHHTTTTMWIYIKSLSQRATSLSLSMANNYEVCLLGVMNRLWFHQIILFPEPTSLELLPKTLKTSKPISESLPCLPYPFTTEEEMSPIPSSVTPPQDDSNNINNEDDGKKLRKVKESPERLNLVMRSKSRRSQSSSPLTKKRSICLSNYSGSIRRLHKTMSCKSLWELELEEVKGFRDLGFIFTKENLSPQMMSVVPGLQRLGGYTNNEPTIPELFTTNAAYKDEDEDEEERRGLMMRPYLSEAWLIKRPDSPLLNLRIPRISAASDMKKHIRNWARTVASVIHQES